ncbi:MAG TPA: Rv2578c family radical SAM protein [Actinospica sp.]|nr:Rv2578c family radical SAM protein [Actinospica sp.]
MRWSGQLIDAEDGGTRQGALFEAEPVVRTFDTPGFRGSTFYEVRAKSVLNRVPGQMPFFDWTVNPYRGCGHRCVYCFARKTHTYLDFDAGLDFDTRIVVKVNAPEVLRRELARPSWTRDHVAMGTNVDCYQRAEGRYRLMPGIIKALADSGTPFSILTKGTLILRDLPLLKSAAREVDVGLSMSIGFVDEKLWREVEPGTPSPARRLDTVRALTDAGLGCSVLMAPILPRLSDSPEQLRATVEAIAAAGATSVTPLMLHLRPGAREWYAAWLKERHPDLVARYRALYRRGSYLPQGYADRVTAEVREIAAACGIKRPVRGANRKPAADVVTPAPAPEAEPRAEQLSLWD